MKELELKIIPSTRLNRLTIHKLPSNIVNFIFSKRIYINTTKNSVAKLYSISLKCYRLKKAKEKIFIYEKIRTIFFSAF